MSVRAIAPVNIIENLSSTLLRLLPREYFLKIRSIYFKLKKKVQSTSLPDPWHIYDQ